MSPQSTPCDLDAERALLCAMFLVGVDIKGLENFDGAWFYRQSHRAVYDAMCAIEADGYRIDLLLVKDRLDRAGKLDLVGGMSYLTDLMAITVSAANAPAMIERVRNAAVRRQVRSACEIACQGVMDATSPVNETIDGLMAKLVEVGTSRQRGLVSIGEVVPHAIEELEDPSLAKADVVLSELGDLDRRTGGWRPGDFIVVGARPSMGKTALQLGFAITPALRHGLPVAFFSLEMSTKSIVQRVAAQLSGVDLQRAITGQLDQAEKRSFGDVLNTLRSIPFHISDVAAPRVSEIRRHAQRLKSRHGLRLVVIDYLQLVAPHPSARTREQEVGGASREFKALAKDLGVPVIVGAQLNREVERRSSSRPVLADLRDSGAIEQDADIVCLIDRPHKDKEKATPDELRKTTLIIAKHRNGPTGDVPLVFEPHCARFSGLSPAMAPGARRRRNAA